MSRSTPQAIQDFYSDDFAHCYGCGRLNPDGLRLKTRWQGDDTVSAFTPRPRDVAVPGFVYGGLIASLIDCHAMATASAAAERTAGRRPGEAPAPRYVTASLHVDYLKPTPHGPELEIYGRIARQSERKYVVSVTVSVSGTITARGEVVAVALPSTMHPQ